MLFLGYCFNNRKSPENSRAGAAVRLYLLGEAFQQPRVPRRLSGWAVSPNGVCTFQQPRVPRRLSKTLEQGWWVRTGGARVVSTTESPPEDSRGLKAELPHVPLEVFQQPRAPEDSRERSARSDSCACRCFNNRESPEDSRGSLRAVAGGRLGSASTTESPPKLEKSSNST
jgi:hypothetical protein